MHCNLLATKNREMTVPMCHIVWTRTSVQAACEMHDHETVNKIFSELEADGAELAAPDLP